LKHIVRSPAHYLEALRNPPKETAAMRFGTALHAAVLGGGGIAVWEGDRRGNEWKCFEEDNRDKLILKTNEHKVVMAAAHAVMTHKEATRVLTGRREVSMTWQRDGRKCGGRIDVIGADFVTELKATTCAEPEWFQRHARSMGYVAQLSWYLAATKKLRGHIVAVEMKPPHAVTVFELTAECIEQGDRQITRWLETLRLCEESNVWPAYTQALVPFHAADDVNLIIDEEEAA
jgi:hypothetical protein